MSRGRKAGGAAITRETVSDKLFGVFGKHAERERPPFLIRANPTW